MNEENQEVNLENIAESLGQNQASSPVQSTPEPTMQNTGVPKIEDIFSDTEKEKPEILQPKQPGDENFSAEEVAEQKSVSKRKLIILVVTLFISLVIIVGGYFGYNYFVKSGAKMPFSDGVNLDVFKSDEEKPTTSEGEANVNQIPGNEDVQSSQENKTPVDISAIGQGPLDTDGDGISDQDEIVRGMDIDNPDSDSDGLFDREEVMVYNTDPIVFDTDDDGFSDGDEVKGGYNPLGTGKLYDINQVK